MSAVSLPSVLSRGLRDPERNMGWWVDDSGAFHSYRIVANDPVDHRLPLNPFPDGQSAMIALRQLGMVQVERMPSGVQVRWDVSQADPIALRAVRQALAEGEFPGRTSLCFRYGGWAHEAYPNPVSAAKRIERLQAYRKETPRAMIAFEDHDPLALKHGKPLLKSALDAWKNTEGQALELFDSPFRDVKPYALMLTESNAAGSLFYRAVGRSAHIVSYLGKDWARDVVGTLSTHGHSDIEFENAISEPYFEALETGLPHYSHVRALFMIDPAEPSWVSYQRLVLPYVAASGAKSLAIMVAPDQNVSIPFLEETPDGIDR